MSLKVAGGAMGGVFLPIIVEFAAKGAKIDPKTVPLKISGVLGIGLGTFTGVLPAVWKNCPLTKNMEEKNKFALIAFGAANFATGASILILDWLKQQAGYQFQRDLPLDVYTDGLQIPPTDLIKEV